MDYRACIQASLDSIEDHLKDDLRAESLASIAGFSPYHSYRMFQAYVGKPVMEYVRCRRLAYAVVELARGRRILDIALDSGFETHNGFGKAFRKIYRCAPGMFRLHGSRLVPAKVDLSLLAQYQLKEAIVMEPRIVTRPAFKIAGYELKTTTRDELSNQEVPTFWGSITATRFDILYSRLHRVGKAELGICFPTDPANGDFSYVIAVEVSDFNDVPPGLFTAEIPQAFYAVFTTPANDGEEQIAPAIEGTWKYIHEVWFPPSGYEFAKGKADFEFYPCVSGEKVPIYVPVIKK